MSNNKSNRRKILENKLKAMIRPIVMDMIAEEGNHLGAVRTFESEDDKTSDAHAAAVGKLFRAGGLYARKFKIGGDKKLQKLVGEDLLYKKDNSWWWASRKISNMTISELKNLIKKIENAYENA